VVLDEESNLIKTQGAPRDVRPVLRCNLVRTGMVTVSESKRGLKARQTFVVIIILSRNAEPYPLITTHRRVHGQQIQKRRVYRKSSLILIFLGLLVFLLSSSSSSSSLSLSPICDIIYLDIILPLGVGSMRRRRRGIPPSTSTCAAIFPIASIRRA